MRAVAADVTDADAVRRALEGVDVAFYLVHSLGLARVRGTRQARRPTVAEQAERAGVSQIVYLGGLGDDLPDLSPHLRSRLDTAAALEAGAVPVTTLRAAVVIGKGSAAFETIVALVDRLPAMVAPRWISTETQPIALDDVVRYLTGVAGLADAAGESFDVGGPEVLSYKEMIERIARLRGRWRPIVEVPVLTPRLSSYWLHLVTPVRGGRRAAALSRGSATLPSRTNDRIRMLVPFRADAVRRRRASSALRLATDCARAQGQGSVLSFSRGGAGLDVVSLRCVKKRRSISAGGGAGPSRALRGPRRPGRRGSSGGRSRGGHAGRGQPPRVCRRPG